MPRTIFFIGGDSYPDDRYVETALRTALESEESAFVGHREIFASASNPDNPGGIDVRLDLLERAVRAADPGRDIFLIGRSSGGRVATLVAAGHPVTAVICMGYPFRFPGNLLEPERFVHLATLATPTLIAQGDEDGYGGLELTEHYRLSQAIRLRFYRGNHEQYPATPAGAHIVPQIRQFIDAAGRSRSGIWTASTRRSTWTPIPASPMRSRKAWSRPAATISTAPAAGRGGGSGWWLRGRVREYDGSAFRRNSHADTYRRG